jgi:hypothetical protein
VTAGVRKGLIVAAVHVAIVSSLGAKLLVDRATRPRVWARAAPYDPDLPIRGRYVRIRIEGALDPPGAISQATPVTLASRDEKLMLVRSETPTQLTARPSGRDATVAILEQPLAYFIPEHVPDPSRRLAGEELWVEVTLPARGAPRPIRLGVKRNGVITPLALR